MKIMRKTYLDFPDTFGNAGVFSAAVVIHFEQDEGKMSRPMNFICCLRTFGGNSRIKSKCKMSSKRINLYASSSSNKNMILYLVSSLSILQLYFS